MDLTKITLNNVMRDMDAEIQTTSDQLDDALSRQDIDRIYATAAHLHALFATWR